MIELLEKKNIESTLYSSLDNNRVRCLACHRKCLIDEGKRGFCQVRINRNGSLLVPYGYFSSFNIDPVEKKPVYHFLPGSKTFSFGMYGCNFRCSYCQNFEISQSSQGYYYEVNLNDLVLSATKENIEIFVSTYNEPTVTIEWGLDIFKKVKKEIKKARTGFVSNGYLSNESLEFIKGNIDFIRVDFKSFNKEKYRSLTGGAELDKLLYSIELIYKMNIHLELVTLIVEDFNDSDYELKKMADFIKSISPSIPWHLTRFHPDYKMIDNKRTDVKKIENLIELARNCGVLYVYGGNYLTSNSNTFCPSCKKLLIERDYMSLKTTNLIVKNNKGYCPYCGFEIYGVF